MPRIAANDTEIYYELTGEGEPLVLVHGSWSDHDNWQAVVPGFAESHLVVAYDRRGNGQSPRGGRATRRDHENDLAALIEALDRGPAHVAGTSFGGSIALGLAARRPELLQSVIAHEPPLMSVVAGSREHQPLLVEVQTAVETVLARISAGDAQGAAQQFVEDIALGPGAWEQLPPPLQATMVDSAPAFLDEQRDAGWASMDLTALARIETPVMLSQGDSSPEWFFGIVGGLHAAMGSAELVTYEGAGHAPHLTHPGDYLAATTAFLARSREVALAA